MKNLLLLSTVLIATAAIALDLDPPERFTVLFTDQVRCDQARRALFGSGLHVQCEAADEARFAYPTLRYRRTDGMERLALERIPGVQAVTRVE